MIQGQDKTAYVVMKVQERGYWWIQVKILMNDQLGKNSQEECSRFRQKLKAISEDETMIDCHINHLQKLN